MSRHKAMAIDLLHPLISSHLDIGYIMMAIISPKKNGMNRVRPKYNRTLAKKIISKYLRTITPSKWLLSVLVNCLACKK
jgi:hypothetical protein